MAVAVSLTGLTASLMDCTGSKFGGLPPPQIIRELFFEAKQLSSELTILTLRFKSELCQCECLDIGAKRSCLEQVKNAFTSGRSMD